MANKLFIAALSAVMLLMGETCFSDTIYLKNGQKMECTAQEAEGGYYVDGMFFPDEEIEHLERTPSPDNSAQGKDSLYEKLLNKFDIKSERQMKAEEDRIKREQQAQAELERHKARLQNNKKAIAELDSLYEREREQARRNNAEALSKARQSRRETDMSERQARRALEQTSKNFFTKTRSRSEQRGNSGWKDDSSDALQVQAYDAYDQKPSSDAYDPAMAYDEDEYGQPYDEGQLMQPQVPQGLNFDPAKLMESIQGMFGLGN